MSSFGLQGGNTSGRRRTHTQSPEAPLARRRASVPAAPGGPDEEPASAPGGDHGKALTQLIWEKRRRNPGTTHVVRKSEKLLLLSTWPPSVRAMASGRQVLLLAGAPLARERCRSYRTETIRKSRRVAP